MCNFEDIGLFLRHVRCGTFLGFNVLPELLSYYNTTQPESGVKMGVKTEMGLADGGHCSKFKQMKQMFCVTCKVWICDYRFSWRAISA